MALFQLAVKNAYSKPGRFLLTSLAVLVGVALTTAVFVFTDSLRATFGDLSEDIESGYDLAVRSEIPFGSRLDAAPVSLNLADELTTVKGVGGKGDISNSRRWRQGSTHVEPRAVDAALLDGAERG